MSKTSPASSGGSPGPGGSSRSEFLGRLAYYMMGLSIGLVLLGLWQMQRRSLVARSAEEARVQQQQTAEEQARRLGLPPPSPAEPPAPAR